MGITDRSVFVRSFRIVQEGTSEGICRQPADIFAARFFCDFNEVEGVDRVGRVETQLGLFASPGIAEDAAAVVCIRPVGLGVTPAGF